MSVILRRAGRRDLEGIQVLWMALREQYAKADPRFLVSPDAARAGREHREAILADPRTRFFVAEEGSEILAYLHAQIEGSGPDHSPARWGEILDLAVRDDRRGEGIGSRLLACGLEWLESCGVAQYRVAVPSLMPEACRFFERHGGLPLQQILQADL